MMVHPAQRDPAVGPTGGPYRPSAGGATAVHVTANRVLKRKAEPHDNERLSKRLGLLRLEQAASQPHAPADTTPATPDTMQLDDTKHTVYVYNLDDELASCDDLSGSENKSADAARPPPHCDGDRLVLLPDMERHLRQRQCILPQVLNNRDSELAGMQMVLYSDPRFLSVPEHSDGVRRAVLEARRRLRERQQLQRDAAAADGDEPAPGSNPRLQTSVGVLDDDDDAMDLD